MHFRMEDRNNAQLSQQLFCLDGNDERITSNHICCEEDLCFGLSVYLYKTARERLTLLL